MIGLHITLTTAGILGLIYLVLSFNVSRSRGVAGVNLGDGSNAPGAEPLLVAIRAHANFAEYVPLALILLGGIEYAGAPRSLLIILAILLILGRIAHPFGMYQTGRNAPRAAGAVLTWGVILIESITALVLAL